MADLNPILSSAKAASAANVNAAAAITSNSGKIQDSYNSDALLQRQNAESAALIETVKGQGALQLQAGLQKNALDIGTDIGDASGIQSALAAQYVLSKAEQNKQLAVITAKKSVSFFDDPLQFLINHATINNDIEKHNAAEASADLASGQIATMNKLTTERAVAARTLQTTVTDASVAAAASEVKNKAIILSDDYARNALVTNSASVEKLVALSKDQMQIASTVFDSKVRQEQIGIAQAHLALSREEFNWKKLEKEKGDAVGQYLSDTIIKGYKAMYPNSPDKWIAPNSPKLLSLISGKLPLDGEMKAAYEVGELNSRAANPDGSNRLLAPSPAQFLQLLKYGPQLGPDTKTTTDLMISAAKRIQETPAYKTAVASKNVEDQITLVNDGVKAAFASANAVVKDPSNPYFLPAIDDIIKQSPGLMASNTFLQVINPATQAGVNLSSPEMVLNLGLKAVQSGKVKLNELAVDLGTIYKQGQRVNIQSKQFIPLGLAPKESYNVKVDIGGITDDTIDMSKPADIIRALVKLQTNSIAREAITAGGMVR